VISVAIVETAEVTIAATDAAILTVAVSTAATEPPEKEVASNYVNA
jgi:hypothetical protein